MTIKVTYNVTDVYMTQSVSPVYINVSYGGGGTSGGGVWGTITGTLSNQTDLQTALDLKVPYSGATGDVSLGEYGINVGNVIYDTTPTGIPTEQGATYWDSDAETVALIMNGTIQKIGEDTFYHVRNTTGSTIPKGTAVRFSGTTGNSGRLLIAPMIANGSVPSAYYMGVTAEEIANNTNGKVYHFGKMRNINTSAFNDGDVLYVSPSVAGGLTATAPVAPNNIIVAAAVVHANNNGTLMIRTTLGSNINTDEGVLLTTPTANEGLFYDSGLWVNKSISTALGYTPANAATTLTINGVTYDLSASRTWTISAGISGTIATGQVAYATAANTIGGSNNLFWNNANSRLGIGTNAPAYNLDITGNVRIGNSTNGYIFNSNTISTFGNIFLSVQADRSFSISDSSYSSIYFRVVRNTGAVLINQITDNGTDKLQVNGGVSFGTAFKWNNGSSLLRVNGGIGINRDAFGARALDISGGGFRLTGSISGSFEVNGFNSSFNVSTVGGIAGINITDTSTVQISMTGNSYNYIIQSNASNFRVRDVTAGNIDRFLITSTGAILVNTTSDNGTDKLQVNGSIIGTQYKLSALNTAPATASSTGVLGEIRIDANHIYVCTATNTWKRVAIATF